jgi:hypothetical protein
MKEENNSIAVAIFDWQGLRSDIALIFNLYDHEYYCVD